MKLAVKLTLDGMIRALRTKAHQHTDSRVTRSRGDKRGKPVLPAMRRLADAKGNKR